MTRPAAFATWLAIAAASGCQSAEPPTPAVLKQADPETMARLEAALAGATGRARVELGAGDFTRVSAVPVLPKPPGPQEDRSLALPIVFDLELRGEACYAVRRDTGTATLLTGVACLPA